MHHHLGCLRSENPFKCNITYYIYEALRVNYFKVISPPSFAYGNVYELSLMFMNFVIIINVIEVRLDSLTELEIQTIRANVKLYSL